ncbi:MAG: 3-isopropylmalate dehydrogenase [Theionarchaea archaeon]|nr:3-isopropylmalate dehydrogenase [Theionarchaea archaeon]
MVTVAVLPGEGIGPEVITETLKILQAITDTIEYIHIPVGLESIQNYGEALTDDNLEICRSADAILFGAVGKGESHPEDSLGKLRKRLDLYANFRPIPFFSEELCRVKDVKMCDILMVRELSSGIYFGNHERAKDRASDLMHYTREEIERIAHVAFKEAEKRKRKVTSVDKENVLACSRLWRETVTEVSRSYPVKLNHMYVDACAMMLLISPQEFDVVLTANLFGDILSDESALLSGSIGLLPSASYNYEKKYALFEPVHGSAPTLEYGEANPIGAVLSGALMLEYLGFSNDKDKIWRAVHAVLARGYHTRDMKGSLDTVVSTQEMGDLIKEFLIT